MLYYLVYVTCACCAVFLVVSCGFRILSVVLGLLSRHLLIVLDIMIIVLVYMVALCLFVV